MKQACTLDHVIQESTELANHNWDALVAPQDLSMSDGRLILAQAGGSEMRLDPNGWALGQLCSRLGIPAPYFRRCPPELQDAQFAFWNQQYAEQSNDPNRKLLLRANGSTVRGVLSQRYSCIDNATLVTALAPVVEGSGLVITWFQAGDESFHLRLVDPGVSRPVSKEDPIFAGLHIANSEVGMRKLTVDALVYRLVCTNGLVRLVKDRSIYSKRHIGRQPENLGDNLREAIHGALEESRNALDLLAESRSQPLKDPEDEVKKLGKRWDLSEEVQKSIIQQLSAEPDGDSRYGLINAITATAQAEKPDERFRLESLAGSLL